MEAREAPNPEWRVQLGSHVAGSVGWYLASEEEVVVEPALSYLGIQKGGGSCLMVEAAVVVGQDSAEDCSAVSVLQ